MALRVVRVILFCCGTMQKEPGTIPGSVLILLCLLMLSSDICARILFFWIASPLVNTWLSVFNKKDEQQNPSDYGNQ